VDAIEGDAMTTPVHVEADAGPAQSEAAQNDQPSQDDQLVHLRLRLDAPVGAVWQALVSPEGTATWLGEGAVLRDKGQSYQCADGSAGVVRSFHPLEQLRLTWHPRMDVESSLIEIDLDVDHAGTSLRLWHDGLPAQERPALLAHWQQRLEALAELVPQARA
jgi:uncharacterized protein YndB with AHSA1/START domain